MTRGAESFVSFVLMECQDMGDDWWDALGDVADLL